MLFGQTDLREPENRVLDGVHIGATWQLQLNNLCVAAMRAVSTITAATAIISSTDMMIDGK